MAEISVTVRERLGVDAATAWRVLGAFDGLPAISTATATSTLTDGGRVRVLVNRDGSILWERMLRFDEAGRSLSYTITDDKGCDGLAYGVGYVGIVMVLEDGPAASIFEYAARFEPRPGIGEHQARAAVAAFASDCAAGVMRALARGTVG